jgi:hypothetical protein
MKMNTESSHSGGGSYPSLSQKTIFDRRSVKLLLFKYI